MRDSSGIRASTSIWVNTNAAPTIASTDAAHLRGGNEDPLQVLPSELVVDQPGDPNAASAPIAAASVGVARPVYIDPRTSRISTSAGRP